MEVYGRGKQKGIIVGNVQYDEIPKEMLMVVCDDENKDDIIKIIIRTARTGAGNFGDGKDLRLPRAGGVTPFPAASRDCKGERT